jgi:multicomponent Na+:H+ antiporter subunit C
VGLVTAVGIFHLLGRDLVRIAVGVYLLFNGMNLLVLSVSARPEVSAPLGQLEAPHADPLVQAMVLTAIVIGFGVSTFLLMLSAKAARERKSLDDETVNEWKR